MNIAPTDKPRMVLVVDLDGTLIRSDMLYENFWAAMAASWTTPFLALFALLRGRAALKHRLAELGEVDVRALPYDDTVLQYIRQRQSEGMTTALVTASDLGLAEKIAAHLGIFNLVYGSHEGTNLKGRHKARFLQERFAEGFEYVGDSVADLKVWEKAAKATTVTSSRSLKARVERLGCPVEHLTVRPASAGDYLKALQPQEWLLNLLVLVPLLFLHQSASDRFWTVAATLAALCFLTSGMALARSLLRLGSDRAAARARAKAHTSTIPIFHASVLALFLMLVGLVLSTIAGLAVALVLLVFAAIGLWQAPKAARPSRPVTILAVLLRLVAGLLAAGAVLAG